MEFAKPVKVALGRLEHIAFIKRHLDVYKKPDITQYPIAAYEFDFLDFIYSLGLINILVFVCISLFPTYFKYDPFKVFNIIPIMLLLIANTFLIAAVIVLFHWGLCKSIGFIYKIKTHTFYEAGIFWRVFRVLSLSYILIIIPLLIGINSSVFTHEELGATLNLMLLVTVILIFMLQIKLLALPLYRIGKQFGRTLGLIHVLLVIANALFINNLFWKHIPPSIFINTQEFIKVLSTK
ncbi:hypothetical protein Lmor_0451 [Legionella moravica]|uniref:Uncharacterized protein n=1 Tax=Legionella moravica TaxID=39962 RepID=A0A378K1D8_9GAMM|nr:hypothetical protein [Legionella moravica]KTD37588.1 hypothetical protein Lmor_0451 [Legionella moravica]STX61651.1 Uncharacterised protein [Legionella moravica]